MLPTRLHRRPSKLCRSRSQVNVRTALERFLERKRPNRTAGSAVPCYRGCSAALLTLVPPAGQLQRPRLSKTGTLLASSPTAITGLLPGSSVSRPALIRDQTPSLVLDGREAVFTSMFSETCWETADVSD
jgi:hypothetical protein